MITEFFHDIFGEHIVLATVIIAMIPLVELKGAIPFAMSLSFWGSQALVAWQAFLAAFSGSIIVVPILALGFKPLYNWLKEKKFFRPILQFLVGDVVTRSQAVAENETAGPAAKRWPWGRIAVVVAFVAFPVPLTGVWTGTCFAVLLGLNFWVTCVSVIVGNLFCGLIVAFICAIFPNATTFLLYVFLVVVLVAVLWKVIRHVRRQRQAATPEVPQA